MVNIAFTFKDNLIHEAILVEEGTTVWNIAEAKDVPGVVLPKHTELLLCSRQFILAKKNKKWFKNSRTAELARTGGTAPSPACAS
jgi:hypothetical protein